MDIQLNGQSQQVADHITVQTLLAELGLMGKRLAVEVNQAIVPRSQFEQHILNPNDNVEIVHAIGGG